MCAQWDSDQTARMRSLIWISLGAFCTAKDTNFVHADNEYESGRTDAQSDLSIRWAHMSEGTFSHVDSKLVLAT